MLTRLLLLVCLFLSFSHMQQPTKVGFAYTPNPDVIKCGNYFYYLMLTSPTLSKFNAFVPSGATSYDSRNGVLSNKVGSLAGNCENETI